MMAQIVISNAIKFDDYMNIEKQKTGNYVLIPFASDTILLIFVLWHVYLHCGFETKRSLKPNKECCVSKNVILLWKHEVV